MLQSHAAQEASRQGIDIARAGLRPRLSFEIYGARDSETDVQLPHQRDNIAEATVQLTIPIYQGGEQSAEIRAAKEAASVSLLQIDVVKRQARQQIQAAWAQLAGAQTRLADYFISLDANAVAERGIARQQSVANARSSKSSTRSRRSSRPRSMSSPRSTTSSSPGCGCRRRPVGSPRRGWGLAVPLYDPAKHYTETRDRWYGTTPAP